MKKTIDEKLEDMKIKKDDSEVLRKRIKELEEKAKLTLTDLVNYTKIATAVEEKNPDYINYAFSDYLESKSEKDKREFQTWIDALRNDIQVNIQANQKRAARGELSAVDITKNVIPEWANQPLNNYQKLYSESLEESKISTLIELAKKVGYEPADFSNLVKPEEKYKDLIEAYKEIAKKEAIAKIDGKKTELTKEEEKFRDKYIAIQIVQEMIKKSIILAYDKKYSNKQWYNKKQESLERKYKEKKTIEEQLRDMKIRKDDTTIVNKKETIEEQSKDMKILKFQSER